MASTNSKRVCICACAVCVMITPGVPCLSKYISELANEKMSKKDARNAKTAANVDAGLGSGSMAPLVFIVDTAAALDTFTVLLTPRLSQD